MTITMTLRSVLRPGNCTIVWLKRCYAVKPPAAAASTPATPKASVSSKIMPSMGVDATEQAIVDTDAEKLLSYACINYLKDGANPKLGADADYPDWLWNLNLEKRVSSEYMDAELDGLLFWRQRRRELLKQRSAREFVMRKSWHVQYGQVGGRNKA